LFFKLFFYFSPFNYREEWRNLSVIYRMNVTDRIAKVWNSLPAAEIDFTSLVSFSTSLQDINLRTFTRF